VFFVNMLWCWVNGNNKKKNQQIINMSSILFVFFQLFLKIINMQCQVFHIYVDVAIFQLRGGSQFYWRKKP
jgi:hypothetical protein